MRRLTTFYKTPEYADITEKARLLVENLPIKSWDSRADLVLYCPDCNLTVVWRFPVLHCIVAIDDATDEFVEAVKKPATLDDDGRWNTWADIDRINRAGVRTDESAFASIPIAALGPRGLSTRCLCHRMRVDYDTLVQPVRNRGQQRVALSMKD